MWYRLSRLPIVWMICDINNGALDDNLQIILIIIIG